jgi:hypothetical protein
MSEAITARQRAADRHAALVEGPAVIGGMTLGPSQVYIMRASDGWRLYRSPDGRKPIFMDGPAYRTPREALAARKVVVA